MFWLQNHKSRNPFIFTPKNMHKDLNFYNCKSGKKPLNGQHSSLLQTILKYVCKKIYNIGPSGYSLKTFFVIFIN